MREIIAKRRFFRYFVYHILLLLGVHNREFSRSRVDFKMQMHLREIEEIHKVLTRMSFELITQFFQIITFA